MIGEDLDALAHALGQIVQQRDAGAPHVRELQERVTSIANILRDGQEDPAARTRAADEVDKLVATLGKVATTAKPQMAVNKQLAAGFANVDLGEIGSALTFFAAWLRSPTPESTAVVEKTVAELRARPELGRDWDDAEAAKKREAEIDARAKKDIADAFKDLDLKIKL